MTYEYFCKLCNKTFDVIKSVKDFDRSETCGDCGEFAHRRFVPEYVSFLNTKVEHPEYNPGLGCVVRNKKHRAEIAKSRGLVEVGTQNMEDLSKQCEKVQQEKREKAYDQAFKEAQILALSPGSIDTSGLDQTPSPSGALREKGEAYGV